MSNHPFLKCVYPFKLLHCSLVADKIQVVPEERDAEESAEKENVIEAGLAVFCD
jgi:hypothetical protein